MTQSSLQRYHVDNLNFELCGNYIPFAYYAKQIYLQSMILCHRIVNFKKSLKNKHLCNSRNDFMFYATSNVLKNNNDNLLNIIVITHLIHQDEALKSTITNQNCK